MGLGAASAADEHPLTALNAANPASTATAPAVRRARPPVRLQSTGLLPPRPHDKGATGERDRRAPTRLTRFGAGPVGCRGPIQGGRAGAPAPRLGTGGVQADHRSAADRARLLSNVHREWREFPLSMHGFSRAAQADRRRPLDRRARPGRRGPGGPIPDVERGHGHDHHRGPARVAPLDRLRQRGACLRRPVRPGEPGRRQHKAVTPVAGTGTPGYSGDGGPATAAQIGEVDNVGLDAAGNLYIFEGPIQLGDLKPAAAGPQGRHEHQRHHDLRR